MSSCNEIFKKYNKINFYVCRQYGHFAAYIAVNYTKYYTLEKRNSEGCNDTDIKSYKMRT